MIKIKRRLWLLFTATLLSIASCSNPVLATSKNAMRYKEVLLEICLSSSWRKTDHKPCAYFAAQIETESRWNKDAVSWAGAQGLGQVMPKTGKWLHEVTPVRGYQPFNPVWSIKALIEYDYWNFARIKGNTFIDLFYLATKAYNGGLAWVYRDQKKATAQGLDGGRWEDVNLVNSGRSKSAWEENHNYPIRVKAKSKTYQNWGPNI